VRENCKMRAAGAQDPSTLRFREEALLATDSPPFAVLRNRDFRLLVGGTLVSHTGDLLQSMAISWLVFQLTHSAFKLGLISFCWMLPRLVLGAIGGVVADRFDRRRLLIVTQTVAMVQSIACFVLVVTGRITYGQLVGLTLVLGVADSLHFTARHALVPLLVPPAQLQASVALNAAAMNLTQVIGPSLGGVMIGLVGIDGCLGINAVSFVAILAALFAMRWRPAERAPAPATSIREELLDGLRYVRARERLWVPVIIAYAVAGLAMAYSRLTPVFATLVLHGGERTYGHLLTAPGVGAIVASLAVAARGRRGGAMRRVYGAVLTLVGALAVFATSHSLLLSVVSLAIVGGAQMAFRTTALALCHETTDDAHRGRVMSIFLLDYGLWSFGTLWLGWLCDARGPMVATLTGAGACLSVVAGVAWLARRRRKMVH
jgi:MFS family permease